ncbi:MAG: hypothetical protein IM600_13695 [Bacteroidetes bacterium]|nr:hypothetical protein [Bacteroidota bacterium]MCA6444479.1 hypothetical protein [Bacteroidota bacterium]
MKQKLLLIITLICFPSKAFKIRNFLNSKHYFIIKELLTYLSLFSCVFGIAQNVTIRGKAHTSYAKKVIQLIKLNDFVTNFPLEEDRDTIQADGFFELKIQTEFTQPVILKINNVESKLYIQPNYIYGITLPEVDESLDYSNGGRLEVSPNIIGADSLELNNLIMDYEELQAGALVKSNGAFIGKGSIVQVIDSLALQCKKRYSVINNNYFKNYYNYKIAELNTSISRGENYLYEYYIKNKPIQYTHDEYMNFFKIYFKGYILALASKKKGQTVHNIINTQANWQSLNAFLKTDPKLNNDTIRELVAINNLIDFYYSSEFNPDAIEALIGQLNDHTKINVHKTLTQTILVYLKKMQPGSPAPVFQARSKDGTVGTLTNFKNRWIYLNFFSTKNENSLKEMLKISTLKKKYGDKLIFLSVCVDDSLKNYLNYIKQNPKFDWPIWYNYNKQFATTAKELYSLVGTEGYYLINNTGYLAQSPALSPSTGIEYKLNSIFKVKTKTTKTGIR